MNEWQPIVDSYSHLKNDLGLSEMTLNLLTQGYGFLQGVEAGLPDRVLRYLVDSEEESVLQELVGVLPQYLSQLQGQGYSVTISALYSEALAAHQQVLPSIGIEDVALYCRLARLQDLTAQNYYYRSQMIPFDGQYFLDVFLIHPTLGSPKNADAFPIRLVEKMLEHVDGEPDILAQRVYLANPDDWTEQNLARAIANLVDFADYSLRYPKAMYAALTHPKSAQRVHALSILLQAKVSVAGFIQVLVERAIGVSKRERELALLLLKPFAADALPVLDNSLKKGKVNERLYAVKAIAELGSEAAQDLLTQHLKTEKTEKVRGVIQEVLQFTITTSEISVEYDMLPIPVIELETPLNHEVYAAFKQLMEPVFHCIKQCIDVINAPEELPLIRDHYAWSAKGNLTLLFGDFLPLPEDVTDEEKEKNLLKRKIISYLAQNLPGFLQASADLLSEDWRKKLTVLIEEYWKTSLEKYWRFLQIGTFTKSYDAYLDIHYKQQENFDRKLQKFLEHPSLMLIHVVRLLLICRKFSENWCNYQYVRYLEQYRQYHEPQFSFQDLAAVYHTLGLDPDLVEEHLLS